jgi:hypothetical protein
MATVRKRWPGNGASRPERSPEIADIGSCAARLGITPERVLSEMMRVAFSDLSRVAKWRTGEDGLQVKQSDELDPADAAAIAEIVASAATGRIYRIKMHEKTPGLTALARWIGMLAKPASALPEDEPTEDEASAARQRLIAALDRLAAEAGAGSGDPGAAC